MSKRPFYVELYDLTEFSRLVCALERIPRTCFSFTRDGKEVVSVQMDLLKERPVHYFVPNSKYGHYISYGFKTGKEDCDIVNTISNPTYLYSPIIRIKSLPESLQSEAPSSTDPVYEPVELEDLASLLKLSYGFEESPFPLFAFPDGSKWQVGVFMNFNESDDTSYFCHVKIDYEPTKPFLKYSSKDGVEPSFVSGLSEHGYSYLKVIKLKGRHPLIRA